MAAALFVYKRALRLGHFVDFAEFLDFVLGVLDSDLLVRADAITNACFQFMRRTLSLVCCTQPIMVPIGSMGSSLMANRLSISVPCGQRVRAARMKNGLISCSWRHLSKV